MNAAFAPAIDNRTHPADRILAIVRKLQIDIQEREALIAELRKNHTESTGETPVIEREIARVQSAIDDIGKQLSDPDLELSAEMRLIRERTELESYLKGLHFPR